MAEQGGSFAAIPHRVLNADISHDKPEEEKGVDHGHVEVPKTSKADESVSSVHTYQEGEAVQVLSRSAEGWVEGRVVKPVIQGCHTVHFEIPGCGDTLFRKHLLPTSQMLSSLPDNMHLGQVAMSSKGIQESGAGILVYVLDCTRSRRQNEGAAPAILKEFNVNQDFYELRSRAEINSKFPYQPGVIEKMLVSNNHVLLVGLRSTAFGGSPEECGDESGKTKFLSRHPELPGWVFALQDTCAARKQRFAECLLQLADQLDALHAEIIDPNNEIAFHYNMGCANAGGKWEEYEGMIQDFANTVATQYGKKYKVAIYGCPEHEE